MPQRFLKPGFRTSARLAKCSRDARLLYVNLITLADDWGRYEGDVTLLKNECFPYDDVATEVFQSWLNELIEVSVLVRYSVGEIWYIQIERWTERKRSKSSKYPNPQIPDKPSQESAANAAPSAAQSGCTRSSQRSRPYGDDDGADEDDGADGEARTRDDPADWPVVSQLLPETHRTDAVRDAWLKWVDHRKQIRKKLTGASVAGQAKLLGGLSPPDAVKTIEKSITNTWIGLFEPKDGAKPDGHGARITGKRIKRKPA